MTRPRPDIAGWRRVGPTRAEHMRWLARVGAARMTRRGRVVADDGARRDAFGRGGDGVVASGLRERSESGADATTAPGPHCLTWLWLLAHGLVEGGGGRLHLSARGRRMLARYGDALGHVTTPADVARALHAAGGSVRGAAAELGTVPAAVTNMARRHGLVRAPPGPRRRRDVCWFDAPEGRLPPREFAALYRDVGTTQLADLLDVSPAAVSGRALRLGLRGRRS